MKLIRARRVTLQICILYKPEKSVISLSANLCLERRWIRRKTKDYLLHSSTKADISAEIPWFRKTMDLSEGEGLFITQSSTKADISAELEGNVV